MEREHTYIGMCSLYIPALLQHSSKILLHLALSNNYLHMAQGSYSQTVMLLMLMDINNGHTTDPRRDLKPPSLLLTQNIICSEIPQTDRPNYLQLPISVLPPLAADSHRLTQQFLYTWYLAATVDML